MGARLGGNSFDIGSSVGGGGGGGISGATSGQVVVATGTTTGTSYAGFTSDTSGNVTVASLTSGSITSSITSVASSGSVVGVAINNVVNQTSTAGFTDLLINRTNTAVGSGAQLLLSCQVGSANALKLTASSTIPNLTIGVPNNTTNAASVTICGGSTSSGGGVINFVSGTSPVTYGQIGMGGTIHGGAATELAIYTPPTVGGNIGIYAAGNLVAQFNTTRNTTFNGGITTDPGVAAAAATWKFGGLRTSTALTFSTTNVIQLDVGGTLYSLMTCLTNP